MDGDTDWTEKLIASIGSKPLLYDRSHPDYTKKDLKEKCWMEVGEEVIPDWEHLTDHLKKIKGREMQQRWANLRTCFSRELREQRKVTSGLASRKRRKYIYFNDLLFLLPTVEDAMKSKQESPESCWGQEDSDATASHSQAAVPKQTSLLNPNSSRPKKKITSYDDYSFLDVPSGTHPREKTHSSLGQSSVDASRNSNSQETSPTSFEQSLLDFLKDKKRKEEDIDEDKSFVLSIVPTLKRMSFEKRLEAKMEIMGVLHRLSRPSPPTATAPLPPPPPSQHALNHQSCRSNEAASTTLCGGNGDQNMSHHQRRRHVHAQRAATSTPSPSNGLESVNTFNDNYHSPPSDFYDSE